MIMKIEIVMKMIILIIIIKIIMMVLMIIMITIIIKNKGIEKKKKERDWNREIMYYYSAVNK